MKTYLRFGEIAENEQSINYFSHKLEKGVSVFEIENNMPLLGNMNLINSLALRVNANIYEVTGDIIGIGNDGEPLLKNVVVLNQIDISKEKLSNHILQTLFNTFEITRGEDNKNFDGSINPFTERRKQNKATSEIEVYFDWLKSDGKKYIDLGAIEIFCYRGLEFENSIKGFDAYMGYVER